MIKGSLVALATPMLDGGDIDWRSLDRLLDWHLEQGTDGIVVAGTTGESATLTVREHCRLIEHTVERINKRVPVIAGTGANATHEAIELTESARCAGADACLLVTPYYNKPTQEGLLAHYRSVADHVEIPQILYNVPGRTACDLLNETAYQLAEHPNIVGIKDATGDLERGRHLIEGTPDDFAVYSGDDFTAAQFCLDGGNGMISVTANIVPAKIAAIYEAAEQGDGEAAHAIDAEIVGLHEAMFVESNPIPVKWALHVMGYMSPAIRLPLTPLSESSQEKLKVRLKEAGLI